MISEPLDVLKEHEVRKTKLQKECFRTEAAAYFHRLGYRTHVESHKRGVNNLVAGDPKKAKVLITAHYDTVSWFPIANVTFPCSAFWFWMFQMGVVLALLLPCVGVGFLCWHLGLSRQISFLTGYLLYVLILLLMRFGPANPHTANDNTSGVIAVMEIAASVPEHLRQQVCFVLFDLEERGLVGSGAYRQRHKEEIQNQLMLNLDCVSDGNTILLIPVKKLRENKQAMKLLRDTTGSWGKKHIKLVETGFAAYSSDQKKFPMGVGIGAFHYKKPFGFWRGRIHTHRDTVMDYTNINLLRAAIISLVDNAAR